ncbi:sugar transferase [Myroides indicus]|uniref:Lipopolysaccharide/colanic/teichoic acid biosynthesis glycosyltransferase n=1 Tax=Myroides indicus TaxID=1323422 RepID=A0A4R7FCP5_9FLAO|nr:sugar transferase [Myroides indicus]TDS65013.1 lipopolysaccharide/colanic/teichoic acid biosynthesis glycosyltransferase [Myroides indicus]
MYRNYLKRLFDFIIALLVLLFIFPILLISAVLIKISSQGPLFFLQERLGKNGEIFSVYKFRTMTDKKRDVNREILKGDAEVTKVGYYLRRFKIDELPQILNILKGDMSLVGPRPCMPFQINEFNEDGKYRILVKPGMTGLAQTKGNIYLSWEERWKYDRQYVENISFLLDLQIILKTILIVLLGEEKFLKRPNA